MKQSISVSAIILFSFFLYSCSSTIPLTSNINDFVMMGIKINTNEKVNFTYSSKVQDGNVKAYTKDKVEEVSGPGFNLSESSTLKKMLSEYMNNKFPNLNSEGSTKINISLEDFYIEQYTEESTGKQVVTALFGGETNYILVAKVKVLLTINRNGQEYSKIITGTSEDKYVKGVGTGTSTSNVYRGNESLENVHAKNINNANNKVLMLLNAYFQEIGL